MAISNILLNKSSYDQTGLEREELRKTSQVLTPWMNYPGMPTQFTEDKWDYERMINDDVKINGGTNEWKYAPMRRAISTISAYYNVIGVPREGFDQRSIDIIRMNPFYILLETATCNYLRSITFDVKDADGNHVDSAFNFLKRPNPQESFWDVFIQMVRDLMPYDAGVVTKTFSAGGYLVELHSYSSPEFWGEIDRTWVKDLNDPIGGFSNTLISHGYVRRWWQRSALGYYIRFEPKEILYFKLYPRSNSIYGSDLLKYFKYQYQYLMESNVAAGKMMSNGLTAGVVMTHPQIGSIQTLKQRLASTDDVNTGPFNFGRTIHLIDQEDVKTISNSLVDMEWLRGQQFVFKVIMNYFGYPASEFSMEDISSGRSASYVQRNIMRTRMMATILGLIEDKINEEVLPYLRGYKKGWIFKFDRNVDLDDQIKATHVTSTRASTFSMLSAQGIPHTIALKLAGFGEELTAEERDMLQDQLESVVGSSGEGSLITGEDRADRYSGSDYEETYVTPTEADATTNAISDSERYDGGLSS